MHFMGRRFLFFCMFKTIFSGHNKNWRGTKGLGENFPRVSTGLKQHRASPILALLNRWATAHQWAAKLIQVDCENVPR